MAEIEDLKIVGGSTYTVGNQDIIANAWEAGHTYIKNRSYVIREHRLYVCNVTHTSVEPFDTTKWTEITIGDAIGNNIGDLSQLTTTDKSSLVGAVNCKANESGVAISKSTNFIGVDYNVTPYNITTSSTLSSAVQIRYKYDGNLLTISGRIVLDISSRTGSNGGVTIALKSGKKIKNAVDNYVGVSTYKTEARYGEATILYADADATSFRLSASESYANLQNGKTLVLYVSPLSIELADI